MKALFVVAIIAAGLYMIATNWESLIPPESDTCQTAQNVGGGTTGSPVQVQVNCR